MIEIIRAEKQHVADIGKLWLEFIRFHQDIDPIFTLLDNAPSGFEKEMVRRLMKSPDGLVLVALDKEQAVGYSLAEIQGPSKGLKRDHYGYVHHIAVTAKYRRQSIAEKMLGEIMKWFRSKNVERFELDITTKNQTAYSFWEKHGFTDYMRKLYRSI